ncbi:MAG TPA: ribonuclease HI family protein [bacterium]|nr:ribonuclease HI family protein [bacterium]HQP97530.1 ribonuclease HI family protein [bacterium]
MQVAPPETSQAKKPARSAKIDPAKTYTVYCDGGSRGNPGPAGYGGVICDDSGKEIVQISESIGKATNNVAEYKGLIAVLSKARAMGIRRVVVKMDSELIVRQINGEYRVKQEHLKPLHAKCLAILRTLERWRIQHVPRAQNTVADRLANEAMDTDA